MTTNEHSPFNSTDPDVEESQRKLDASIALLRSLEAKYASEGDRERALLTFLSDMATCIAYALGGSYVLHHPNILLGNPWLACVVGLIIFAMGVTGSTAAAFQYARVLYPIPTIRKERRRSVAFALMAIGFSCIAATLFAFNTPS